MKHERGRGARERPAPFAPALSLPRRRPREYTCGRQAGPAQRRPAQSSSSGGPSCACSWSAAAAGSMPSSIPSPSQPSPSASSAPPATPAPTPRPTTSPSPPTTSAPCWLSPAKNASTSPWSAPRRRWWPASPTSFRRTASRSSARRAKRRRSKAARPSPRRSCTTPGCPPPGTGVTRASRRPWSASRCRRSGRWSSRPTGWRPARASSSARTSSTARPPSTSAFIDRAFGAAGDVVIIEEFLEGPEVSPARALRRHDRRAAGAGAGLQAHLRRRPGTQHRRHGQLLPRARV